ncbi:ComEC/Rec2 family competence protein [Aeromicrobium piscarium]|uniref:DUF4131 domain-containing protein n=1 Tax=Aeromicrobium piscarium TaxID=2590901 RepID=A0A554S7N8_9ACTN|nr:ComEC/Rec2 family competence protein [Aeromicrobium piscarium]TSD62362.1 DUF4131 domain-containing protein [Aeromicrobium piscarium]
MLGHDLRMVPGACAVWAVAVWAVTSTGHVVAIVAAVAALAAVLLLGRRPGLAVIAMAIGLVAMSAGARMMAVEQHPLHSWAEDGRWVTVEATVRQDVRAFGPQREQGVVELTVQRARSSGGSTEGRARLTAFVRGDLDGLTVGRRVVVEGALAATEDSDAVGVLAVQRWQRVGDAAWWWEASERVREGVRSAVDPYPGAGAAIVPALVTGDVTAVDDNLREDFQRSGLTHLTAVSGSNLTIVLGAVLLIVRGIGAKRLTIPAALLAVIVFVLVARPEPSVQRAAVMGTVAVVGLGWGTRDGLRAVAWAVIALLVIDPWMGRAAGFVLSVCATTGIVTLGPMFTRRLEQWLPTWIAMALAVPLAAHLACVPMVAAISEEVSLVAVVSNVAAAPAVAPATILGLTGGLTDLLWAPAARLIGAGAFGAAWWIAEVGQRSASWDGAAIAWEQPWWSLVFVVPVVTAIVLVVLSRPVLAAGLSLGLLVAIVRPPQTGWPPDEVIVVACDVGQGDASVVPLGEGDAIVVDTGMDPGPIDRCLRRLGIERIRLLVFSHADADHVAGWRGAVRGREVEHVMVGPSGGPELPDVPRSTPGPGESVMVGEVEIETLWPDTDHPATDRNDASLVQRFTINGVRVLFTGDLGEQTQTRVAAREDVTAEILKVPHHGSADQSARFHQQTGAVAATVSVGENDYGHPTRRSLDILRDAGIRTWRTDELGDIAIVQRDGELRAVSP